MLRNYNTRINRPEKGTLSRCPSRIWKHFYQLPDIVLRVFHSRKNVCFTFKCDCVLIKQIYTC